MTTKEHALEVIEQWAEQRARIKAGERRVGDSLVNGIFHDGMAGNIRLTYKGALPELGGSPNPNIGNGGAVWEAGYWVPADRAGRGIGTWALGRVSTIGFRELGASHIILETDFDNPASQKVAEKAGFVRGISYEKDTHRKDMSEGKIIKISFTKEAPVEGQQGKAEAA